MSSPPPDTSGPRDPGRGPMIAGVSWALTGVSVIAVAVRLRVRYRGSSRPTIDDWLIVLAEIVFMAFVQEGLRGGGGMHDEDLTIDELIYIFKWFWLSSTPAIFVSIIARISAAILLIRIFGTKNWFKWFLIIFGVLQAVAGVCTIITTWTQVRPVEALWNPLVTPTTPRNEKVNDVFVNVSGALFAFTDLSFVFLPAFIIWRLHMAIKTKLGLIILMSLSLISFIGSIMKPITTQAAESQYDSSIVLLWSAVEQSLVIIISCVPPLRSVVLQKLPLINTITESMVRLMTLDRGSRGSRKGSTTSSGPAYGRSRYYDINGETEGSVKGSTRGSNKGHASDTEAIAL